MGLASVLATSAHLRYTEMPFIVVMQHVRLISLSTVTTPAPVQNHKCHGLVTHLLTTDPQKLESTDFTFIGMPYQKSLKKECSFNYFGSGVREGNNGTFTHFHPQ